jgi:L-arabinose isomerase
MPHLPVAKALWEPRPNLEVAGAAWIHAGGAHHSVYTQGVSLDEVSDFAEMAGVELVVIGSDTDLRNFKQELRQNAVYYHLNQGV